MTKHSKIASGCLLFSLIPIAGSSMAFDLKEMASQLQQVALQGDQPQPVQSNAKPANGVNVQNDSPCNDNGRTAGTFVGGAIGAIFGRHVADNKNLGTVVGAALGGMVGRSIGADIDKRQCELSRIQKKYGLDMEVMPIAVSEPMSGSGATDFASPNKSEPQKIGLSIAVVDQEGKPQFEAGSDRVLPDATQHFSEIARQYLISEQVIRAGAEKTDEEKKEIYSELRRKRILLIGHTDDTGNSSQNAKLSEQRAKAVAKLFKSVGVDESQLYYQGAGETLPIADNSTPEGRAKNRRVEIVDLTNDEAFKLYLQNRRANADYYRPAVAASDLQPSNAHQIKGDVDGRMEQTVAKTLSTKKESPVVVANKSENKSVERNSRLSKSKDAVRPVIDFGGVFATGENATINIGEVVKENPKFTLINEAHASNMTRISSCYQDRPRDSGTVKSLKDGKEYATNEHLPGLNGRSWHDMVGGNLIMLNRVAVLRDGAAPANLPDLKVYANYNPDKNRNPKPDVSMTPAVNIYRGDGGLLYRVFVQGDHGLQCMDVLMPMDSSGAAKAGKVVYGDKGNERVANFKLKMIH